MKYASVICFAFCALLAGCSTPDGADDIESGIDDEEAVTPLGGPPSSGIYDPYDAPEPEPTYRRRVY